MIRYNLHNMKGKKITDTLNFDNLSIEGFEKENKVKLKIVALTDNETWQENLVKFDVIGFMHREVKADFNLLDTSTELCMVFAEKEIYSKYKFLVDEKKIDMIYNGIIEIYPQRFTNSMMLDKLLHELKNDYTFTKIFNTIRAFEK